MISLSYIALYREWRPKIFEDVIGQEHITQTLKNQIKNENIAHAYLFCGSRGTGKTSMAKIFAKAVNCLDPKDHNPCGSCEICSGIDQENIMDVIEIDAASNNGVDDVRELRESVQYPPSKGKYKVYIIDEVHMLSKGAFNALLKTLEEPPHYVIFILATTEAHKIPATVLSRCQRFDFKRVKESAIEKHLAYICSQMNVKSDDKALKLIARNAQGSVRDALSILDQCISFRLDMVMYEDVLDILGVPGEGAVFQLVDYIIEKDSKKAMEQVEELISAGKDIQQIINSLISHYRDLMMLKIVPDPEGLLNLSEESIGYSKGQAQKLESGSIMRAIHLLSQSASDAKWSTQPRILLEVAILKLIRPESDASIEGLLERVEYLERVISSETALISKPEIKKEKKEEKEVKFYPKKIDNASVPLELESKELESKELETEELESTKLEIKEKKQNKSIDFEALIKDWDRILKEIKKRKISVHAILMEGNPVCIENNSLIVVFKDGFGFHKEAASKNPYKEFIENIIQKITGQKIHLKCVMEDEMQNFSAAKDETSATQTEDEEVQKIIDLFGEEIVEIIDE